MKTTTGPLCALALSTVLPLALLPSAVHAQESGAAGSEPAQQQSVQQEEPGSPIHYAQSGQSLAERTLGDAKAYFSAPLHWNARNWEYFGGALAVIAAAHHYDTQVRNHYDEGYASPLGPRESGEITDLLPSAALLVGTWGYANLLGSNAGKSETWNMVESTGLSMVTAYALKYAIRRTGPGATTDPNDWFKGGSSFPSEHTTMAFAIGSVLAESGNPDYRWIRRVIGYGVGFGTAYLRLKHNAHWLSDTVAGGALGMASAHFVMNRSAERDEQQTSQISLVPVDGGVMLAYTASLPN
jgi:hypothetical protein